MVHLCHMQQAYEKSMVNIVVCKSNLQLAFKTVFRTGKMLWKFETCFKTLYDIAGKAGLSNSVYVSMLHNPMMHAHGVSKVSFAL